MSLAIGWHYSLNYHGTGLGARALVSEYAWLPLMRIPRSSQMRRRYRGAVSQGVDFTTEGVDPILSQDLYRLFGLVYTHNDYGLPCLPPTKIGI